MSTPGSREGGPIETVLVTGATGKTGRRVVRELEERGVAVRAASRSSDVRFDWDDDRDWDAALTGADSAYLVLPALGSPESVVQLAAFTARARDAGVRRLVLVSTPANGGLDPQLTGEVERLVRESGLEWTILRLRWFAQNFSEDFLLEGILSGSLRIPAAHGRDAFVDAEDIAAVAAAALVDDGHHGHAYEVTGPRLLSFADTVAEISKASGREVTYVALAPEEYAVEQRAQGVPEEWVAVSGAIYAPFRTGALETVSTDVERVLGRPARDFSEFARDAAAAGAWSR